MRTHRSILSALLAVGMACCVGRARAEPEPMQLEGADKEFVTAAGMGSVGEVKLGQLAIEHAESADVKRFARRMVEDHGKANTELTSLAKEKSAPVPMDAGPEHKVALAKLAALSGAAFDKAYMAQMVEDHRRDIAAFENQIRTGKDPVVRAWASKMLPTLRLHLRMARELASRSGAAVPERK